MGHENICISTALDLGLEGLAKKELNLSVIVGKSVEARERRLVPEIIEAFFQEAAPVAGMNPKPITKDGHIYRVGRVPRTLVPIGQRLESRFGRLGREYQKVVFDKVFLPTDPTLEWVTPGHPLFEVVREDVIERTAAHLRQGAVFFDLHRKDAARLDTFAASVVDGRGRTLHRRLFVVEALCTGEMQVRQPTIFHELVPAPARTPIPDEEGVLPDRTAVERHLLESALNPFLKEIAAEREREIRTIREHVDISLNVLIDRQNQQLADYLNRQVAGSTVPGLDGLIAQSEAHLDELNNRLESRRRELDLERNCTISEITPLGRAWVLPHPERASPRFAPMVRDDEIERIAVEVATRHEEARGWQVESVEEQNRGFDLISRRAHPEDPKTFIEVRFIEVKGRAAVGEVALSGNEYRTAQRLATDYWLYVVFDCAATPSLTTIQDPARLGWEPVMRVEQYLVTAKKILEAGGE